MSHSLGGLACSLSMPDCTVHEIIRTVVSSWCPDSLPYSVSGKARAQGSKSSFSVLKAKFIHLKNRLDLLEAENQSLKFANRALQSDVAAMHHELSGLKAEHYHLAGKRKQIAYCEEQSQQKIRALSSDIGNAQNSIMAMIDINLHESFLRDAAESTITNGQHAEEAPAVTRAVDKKGSIYSSAIDGVRSPDKYVATVDLALQTGESLRDIEQVFRPRHAKPDAENDTFAPLDEHSSASLFRCSASRPFNTLEMQTMNSSNSLSSTSSYAVSLPSSSTSSSCSIETSLDVAHCKPTSPRSSGSASSRHPLIIRNTLVTSLPINSSTKEVSFIALPREESLRATGTQAKTSIDPETMALFSARNSDKRRGIIITEDANLASALVSLFDLLSYSG